jgi:hypothetical protein
LGLHRFPARYRFHTYMYGRPYSNATLCQNFKAMGVELSELHVFEPTVFMAPPLPPQLYVYVCVCVCVWTHLRSGMHCFVQSAKPSVKNCRRVYQAPPLSRRMAMSYIGRNTRGFEWNVVSKFESNRWRTVGVAFIVTNGRLHFYLYRLNSTYCPLVGFEPLRCVIPFLFNVLTVLKMSFFILFSRLYDVSIILRPFRHYAIFLLQLFLSVQSSSCKPFSPIIHLIPTAQVSLGLLRFLLPDGRHSSTPFGSLPCSILWTCPYHWSCLVFMSSKRDLVTKNVFEIPLYFHIHRH